MSKLIKANQQHEEKVKNYISAMYLLSLAYETYSDNLREYIAENKLKSELSEEFFHHKRSMAKIKKKIIPMIGEENKMNLFEDYEKFINLVDTFLKH